MNLPNSLTVTRIFLVPLLVVVLLTKIKGPLILGLPKDVVGAMIFALASLTVWADGYLARRRKQITPLGQVIDPLADKLLTSAALISLVQLDLAQSWMVAVIIGREFAVTTLRSLAYARGVAMPASPLGKIKMVAQVVAILALLIAILIPSLSRSRAIARRTKCLANLRGLGHTVQMYTAEWRQMLGPPPPPNASDNRWTMLLLPYGNNEKIRQCPDANSTPMVGANGGQTLGTTERPWYQPTKDPSKPNAGQQPQSGAYAYNFWAANATTFDEDNVTETDDNDDGTHGVAMFPERFWRFPIQSFAAVVPVFAESTWSVVAPLQTNVPPAPGNLTTGETSATSTNQMGNVCITRHGKTVNVVFFDGHADNVKLPDLWTLKWNAQWTRNTPADPQLYPYIR
jgi:CDP-diacylglycerol--glycerol-3-phosphate 3-phosphatidyltransferase